MGRCTLTLKTCLLIMSLLLWVAAAGLMYVGSIIFKTYKHITELGQSLDVLAPAIVILCTGVFLFVVGSIGWCSAFKESNCLRATFFVLLFILVAGEITGAGLGLHYKSDVETIVTDRLHYMINNYQDSIRDEVDYIQDTLECCGADSFDDWFNSTGSNHTVPQSCCRGGLPCAVPRSTTANATAIYSEACIPKVESFFDDHLWYIAGPAIGFAVVQVVCLVATCWLMCIKKEVPYLSLSGESGYRV